MKCLPLLVLAVVPLFAQTSAAPGRRAASKSTPSNPPEQANKWPIVSLSVEGNHRYTAAQVLAVAGLKTGQVAGKEEFDAARDRLVASGFFEMVAYKFEPAPNQNGEIGTLQVTEADPTYPVRFEALGVPSAELEAMLHGKDPMFSTASVPPTKPVLDRYTAWIQDFLTSKGSAEKVVTRIDASASGQLAIVFRPARNLPVVALVTFEGNKAVSQDVLRDFIAGVAVGVPYTEDHFRELLNTGVRPVYEARGRLRVKFTNIRTEPASGVEGLHVFVTVDEGETYKLAKLEVAGPTPLRPAQLLKTADVPTGDTANFDRIADGMEKMRKSLVRAGYMEAKLTSDRSIDDANKTVDVAVHVDSGPLFTMGKLTITGLDLDGEAEMRRIWAIKEGKPFDPQYPDMFLKNVREQNLFDNLGETKSATKVNDTDHSVDVTLTFGGASAQPKDGRGGRGGGAGGGRGRRVPI
jgi:outer membrane protein insertion porin family